MIRQTFGATFSQRNSLMRGLAALAVALPLLAACSGDDEPAPYVEQPVEDLYNTAADTLAVGDDYELAAQQFEEVERQHPYSVWASKAQLMSAYSYYLANEYDDAISALDRFVALHPGSQYARDARLKIDLANDHLAGKEMTIGRYYLSKKNYLAALNRFQTVVRDYQTTTHVPEALHRLVEINLVLGLQKEAQATGAVLGYNFPGSDWYLDSYALLTGEDLRPEAQEGSWIGSVWDGIF
jgi:outer membrane protein assembly factor BamD